MDKDTCNVPDAGANSTETRSTSFLRDWNFLLGGNVTFQHLKDSCLRGCLRYSNIRSIIWRILLKVLPTDRTQWISKLGHDRELYEKYKADFNVDPRRDHFSTNVDLDVFNPLSQTDNPWKQYFDDTELRNFIEMDVNRTFPELPFFNEKNAKDLLREILFIYSKLNLRISYKQGMNEILAPILLVVYTDLEAYAHLVEQNLLEGIGRTDRTILNTINDPRYLEHDTFWIFRSVIAMLESWYDVEEPQRPCNSSDRANEQKTKSDRIKEEKIGPVPFSTISTREKEDLEDTKKSKLLQKLYSIHRDLLRRIDPPLYEHLCELEIVPQIYGIRWLRLLFSREFPLHDLLFLWDTIFASHCCEESLALVDYIFIALLVQIRHLLLNSDFSLCLNYLMHYPPVADVHAFINYALHLKTPTEYPKPLGFITMTHFSHITLAGTSRPNYGSSGGRFNSGNNAAASQIAPTMGTSGGAVCNRQLSRNSNGLADICSSDIGNPGSRFSTSNNNVITSNSATTNASSKTGGGERSKENKRPIESVLHKIGISTSFSPSHSATRGKTPPSQKAIFYNEVGTEANEGDIASAPGFKRISNQEHQSPSSPQHHQIEELVKEQISMLQTRLNDLDVAASQSAHRLIGCVDYINRIFTDDEVASLPYSPGGNFENNGMMFDGGSGSVTNTSRLTGFDHYYHHNYHRQRKSMAQKRERERQIIVHELMDIVGCLKRSTTVTSSKQGSDSGGRAADVPVTSSTVVDRVTLKPNEEPSSGASKTQPLDIPKGSTSSRNAPNNANHNSAALPGSTNSELDDGGLLLEPLIVDDGSPRAMIELKPVQLKVDANRDYATSSANRMDSSFRPRSQTALPLRSMDKRMNF